MDKLINKLGRFQIGSRIGVGFAILLALTSMIAVEGWRSINTYEKGVARSSDYQHVKDQLQSANNRLSGIAKSGDPQSVEHALTSIEKLGQSTSHLNEADDTPNALLQGVEVYSDAARTLIEKEVAKYQLMPLLNTAGDHFDQISARWTDESTKAYSDTLVLSEVQRKQAEQARALAVQASELGQDMTLTEVAALNFLTAPSTIDPETINQNIKSLFLEIIGFKKNAKGTAAEQSVNDVASQLITVRRSLKQMIESAEQSKLHEAERTLALNGLDDSSTAFVQAGDSILKIIAQAANASQTKTTGEMAGLINLSANVGQLQQQIGAARALEQSYAQSGNKEDKSELEKAVKAVFVGGLKLKKTASDPAFAPGAKAIMSAAQAYRKSLVKLFDAVDAHKLASSSMQEASQGAKAAIAVLRSAMSKIIASQVALAAKLEIEAENAKNERATRDQILATVRSLNDVKENAQKLTVSIQYNTPAKSGYWQNAQEEFSETFSKILANLQDLEGRIVGVSDTARPMTAEFSSAFDAYATKLGQFAQASEIAALERVNLSSIRVELENVVNEQMATRRAEMDQTSKAAYQQIVSVGLLALALGLLSALVVTLSVTRPISDLAKVLGELRIGKLDQSVPGLDRRDALGGLAEAVDTLRQRGLGVRDLERKLDAEVKTGVQELADEARKLDQQSNEMIEGMAAAQSQTAAMVSTMEESRSNLENISAASSQLGSSSQDVAVQVKDTTTISKQAVEQLDKTSDEMRSLVDAAGNVTGAVQLIRDIAEQTNLLALNATIEAARAGDAGRGFAVVASEVKGLAEQTAQVTEQIAKQIETMSKSSSGTENALSKLSDMMGEIDKFASTVSSATHQQSQSTKGIGENLGHILSGIQNVTEGASQLQKRIQLTDKQARSVGEAIGRVEDRNEKLRDSVDAFIQSCRAG